MTFNFCQFFFARFTGKIRLLAFHPSHNKYAFLNSGNLILNPEIKHMQVSFSLKL